MTNEQAINEAINRYTSGGGNKDTGLQILNEIISEPWCLADSLVHYNFATRANAKKMAEALK